MGLFKSDLAAQLWTLIDALVSLVAHWVLSRVNEPNITFESRT